MTCRIPKHNQSQKTQFSCVCRDEDSRSDASTDTLELENPLQRDRVQYPRTEPKATMCKQSAAKKLTWKAQ